MRILITGYTYRTCIMSVDKKSCKDVLKRNRLYKKDYSTNHQENKDKGMPIIIEHIL